MEQWNDACRLELRHGRFQLFIGRRDRYAELLEEVDIVEDRRGGQRRNRDAINLAIDREGAERGGVDTILERLDLVGDRHHKFATDVGTIGVEGWAGDEVHLLVGGLAVINR